jgi:hypothetical protein
MFLLLTKGKKREMSEREENRADFKRKLHSDLYLLNPEIAARFICKIRPNNAQPIQLGKKHKCLVLLARLSLPTCAPLAHFQNGSSPLPPGTRTLPAIAKLVLSTMTFVRLNPTTQNSALCQSCGSPGCDSQCSQFFFSTVVEERPDVQRVR